MRALGLSLIVVLLAVAPALFAEGEEEVSFAELVAKPSDFDGKTVKVSCHLLIAGSEVLAVNEVKEEDGEISCEGEAALLKKVKSSVKKKLTKGKYKKRTSYYGPVVITGVVKTGEFGRKKKYKVQITVKSVEVLGGASEGFTILKKNKKSKANLDPEDQVRRESRQAVRRDGFNPPTYPQYHDGSNLAASTQVLCITDGRQAKAYPIGIMGGHELANDKIGKVPVAVTW